MKKYTSMAMLGMICAGVLLQSAPAFAEEQPAMANSNVTANVKSGGLLLEIKGNALNAKDADFSKLVIGQDIADLPIGNLINVTDHTGGDGWTVAVKNTSYTDNESLNLKLGTDEANVDLTGSDSIVATGQSQLATITREGTFSATWGATPKKGDFKNELEWTLTPGIAEADVDVNSDENDGKVYIANMRPAYHNAETSQDYGDVWGKFEINDNGTLTLVNTFANRELTEKLPGVGGGIQFKIPDTVDGIKVTEVGTNTFKDPVDPINGGYVILDSPVIFPKYLEHIHDDALSGAMGWGNDSPGWIPSTVKTIGNNALGSGNFRVAGFENLESIGEANSVNFIFEGDVNLSKLKSYSDNAFNRVDATGSLILGKDLKTVPYMSAGYTVDYDKFLSGTVTIPEGIESIPGGSLGSAHFTGTLTLPSTLTEFGGGAMSNTQFDNVVNNSSLSIDEGTLPMNSIRMADGTYYGDLVE